MHFGVSLNAHLIFWVSAGQCVAFKIRVDNEPMEPLIYDVSDSIVVDLIRDACD